jgi:hypothetical protein
MVVRLVSIDHLLCSNQNYRKNGRIFLNISNVFLRSVTRVDDSIVFPLCNDYSVALKVLRYHLFLTTEINLSTDAIKVNEFKRT